MFTISPMTPTTKTGSDAISRSFAESHDRLVEHPRRDAEQQHGVREGGEDLESVETERALPVGARTRRGVDRGQRHSEPQRVRCHVP